ncbi:hypothetical protein MC885_020685 [Smutsia gigantea]|nr:hypothetical protein MC885_020685 [Smutsia gigantea]
MEIGGGPDSAAAYRLCGPFGVRLLVANSLFSEIIKSCATWRLLSLFSAGALEGLGGTSSLTHHISKHGFLTVLSISLTPHFPRGQEQGWPAAFSASLWLLLTNVFNIVAVAGITREASFPPRLHVLCSCPSDEGCWRTQQELLAPGLNLPGKQTWFSVFNTLQLKSGVLGRNLGHYCESCVADLGRHGELVLLQPGHVPILLLVSWLASPVHMLGPISLLPWALPAAPSLLSCCSCTLFRRALHGRLPAYPS